MLLRTVATRKNGAKLLSLPSDWVDYYEREGKPFDTVTIEVTKEHLIVTPYWPPADGDGNRPQNN